AASGPGRHRPIPSPGAGRTRPGRFHPPTTPRHREGAPDARPRPHRPGCGGQRRDGIARLTSWRRWREALASSTFSEMREKGAFQTWEYGRMNLLECGETLRPGISRAGPPAEGEQ